MKFGVVIFPGSNCDEDMVYAWENIMGQQVERLWHKEHDLKGCDFIVVPGGFSYGDYLRSGAIARFSPIMSDVIAHANKGGYVLGICNGFQILTESGLLPGVLLANKTQRFVCKNAFIKPITKKSPITAKLQRQAYKIPVAHAEGRFFAKEDALKEIQDNDQVIFKYCNELGSVSEDANFNGSLASIAGLMNKQRNVLGMMPHPERAADPALGNIDGRYLFESILEFAK